MLFERGHPKPDAGLDSFVPIPAVAEIACPSAPLFSLTITNSGSKPTPVIFRSSVALPEKLEILTAPETSLSANHI